MVVQPASVGVFHFTRMPADDEYKDDDDENDDHNIVKYNAGDHGDDSGWTKIATIARVIQVVIRADDGEHSDCR